MQWLLYIDDDQDDREMFLEICLQIKPDTICEVASNWEEASNKLKSDILPICIYVDMNMPVTNGLQVLQMIRKDAKLANIPAFIISTSKTEILENDARRLGAAYLIKPASYDKFKELLTACFAAHV